jgi:hypothetical protein
MKSYTAIQILMLFSIISYFSCNEEICEVSSFEPHYSFYEGQIGATGNSTVESYDHNLIICGNNNDLLTVLKISKEGAVLWKNDFSREPLGMASGIAESMDHNIFICGKVSRNNNPDTSDILLVKLNAIGDTIWSKTYPENFSTRGSRIIQTSDNNILIAGQIEDTNQDISSYFALIKTDLDGHLLWYKYYDLGIYIFNLLESHDGNLIITGEGPFQNNQGQLILIKIGKNGDVFWEKVIGPQDKLGHQTIELSNGDLVTCGNYSEPGGDDSQLLLIKTDSLGNILWEMHHGNPEYAEIGQVIAANGDGGFTIAGYAIGVTEHETENILMRVNLNGELNWCETFKEGKNSRCENLFKANDDRNIITGTYAGDIFMATYDNN